jgi:hypothetical protein
MKNFGIITLALVLLFGVSVGAMEAGKLSAVNASMEADNIIVPIELNNNVAMTAMDLPLKFSEGVTLVGVSFDGTRSENFDLKVAKIDNDNNTVVIGLIPMVYGEKPVLEPGSGVIANLEFSITDPTVEDIEIETTSMENPSHDLMFVYSDEERNLVDLQPEFANISVALSEVGGNSSSMLPVKYDLKQNAPNPFNPTTVLSYDLPKASHVSLEVYNVLGQNVKTLVDTYQEAGTNSVMWDGTDNGGTQVASGLYFYRLTADGFQATKKMMMLK